MYVDGLPAECHGRDPKAYEDSLGELRGTTEVSYSDQPYYPSPLPPSLPGTAGTTDLVYLDVWPREVTALEDPAIQEIALGGPDTATRLQTAWQVKVLKNVGARSCADPPAAWDALVAPSPGRLTTSAVAPPASDDPCVLSPSGGYRGLENRLYRVEIHSAGPVGGSGPAEFKWSRDNGSVISAVEAISAGRDELTVKGLGRDPVLRFQIGDWVEVLDDHTEFKGEAGLMAKVTKIDEANRILTIAPAIPAAFNFDATKPERHTRVRRWDQLIDDDDNDDDRGAGAGAGAGRRRVVPAGDRCHVRGHRRERGARAPRSLREGLRAPLRGGPLVRRAPAMHGPGQAAGGGRRVREDADARADARPRGRAGQGARRRGRQARDPERQAEGAGDGEGGDEEGEGEGAGRRERSVRGRRVA